MPVFNEAKATRFCMDNEEASNPFPAPVAAAFALPPDTAAAAAAAAAAADVLADNGAAVLVL